MIFPFTGHKPMRLHFSRVQSSLYSAPMKWPLSDDQIFRIIGAVVLIVGVLLVVAVRRAPRGPGRCPIDGHIAEWTKRRDNNSCDYGHFSGPERTYHTWTAACE